MGDRWSGGDSNPDFLGANQACSHWSLPSLNAFFGADDRHRTCSILFTRQALCHLSYIGKKTVGVRLELTRPRSRTP